MINRKNILFIGNNNRTISKIFLRYNYQVFYTGLNNLKSKKSIEFEAIILDSIIFQDIDFKNLIEFLKNFRCQIFLLKTNANNYQNIANRIIDTKINTIAYNKKNNQFCKNLSMILSVKIIDISSYYFSKKKRGKVGRTFDLEDEYYIDVSNIIFKALNNENVKLNKPDFSLALARLIKYKLTIIDKVKFQMNDTKLWQFACSCDTKFLNEYQEIIIQLSTKNIFSINGLKGIKQFTDENFLKTLEAYIFVKNKNFNAKTVRYEYIFKNKMKIIFLKEMLQEYALKTNIIKCKNEINFLNYGYFFAKMFNKNVKDYKFSHINPIIVDIWGSCISRLPFNFDDGNFAVDKYFFQILPFNLSKQISYNEDIFIKNHTWQDKILKQVLDGKIIESIENHKSKWLIMDIHCLTSKKIYTYDNKIFVDFNQNVSKLLGATKISNLKDVLTDREIETALKNFCSLIGRYYDKIILIKNKWQIFYKTDDNKIKEFKDSNVNFQNNIFIEKCLQIVKDNLDCYILNDVDDFYSDEKSILRNSPVHYEDGFYKKILKRIKKICLNI